MLSSGTLSRLAHKYNLAEGKIAKIKEKTEETMGAVLQTAEVLGAGSALSYANGRYGEPEAGDLLPVWMVPKTKLPVSLAAGAALHLAAFAGLAGKYGEHAHNLGDGALLSYLAPKAMSMGAKAKALAPAAKTTAGALGSPFANPYAYQPRTTAGAYWRPGHASAGAVRYPGVG